MVWSRFSIPPSRDKFRITRQTAAFIVAAIGLVSSSEIETPKIDYIGILDRAAANVQYENPLATPYEAVLNRIANTGTEVNLSPCRPAMGGLYSVNSANICHLPLHVAAWSGFLRALLLRSRQALLGLHPADKRDSHLHGATALFRREILNFGIEAVGIDLLPLTVNAVFHGASPPFVKMIAPFQPFCYTESGGVAPPPKSI